MMKFRKMFPLLLLVLILIVSSFLMAASVFAAGEQLYLYDRFLFPELPVSLDEYPYLMIGFYDGAIVFLGCTTNPVFADSKFAYSDADGSLVVYVFVDDSWILVNESSYSEGHVIVDYPAFTFMWSSFDVSASTGILCYGSVPVLYSPVSDDAPAEPVAGTGIFYQAYDLFSSYIYGVEAESLTSDQMLTLTFLATVAALFLVSLPFLFVLGFIKLFR